MEQATHKAKKGVEKLAEYKDPLLETKEINQEKLKNLVKKLNELEKRAQLRPIIFNSI